MDGTRTNGARTTWPVTTLSSRISEELKLTIYSYTYTLHCIKLYTCIHDTVLSYRHTYIHHTVTSYTQIPYTIHCIQL